MKFQSTNCKILLPTIYWRRNPSAIGIAFGVWLFEWRYVHLHVERVETSSFDYKRKKF